MKKWRRPRGRLLYWLPLDGCDRLSENVVADEWGEPG
jgi:hypothetical protein